MRSKVFNLFPVLMIVAVAVFGVKLSAAPVTTLPYTCSFEDQAENLQWKVNTGAAGASSLNKWAFSNAASYVGSNAMLISNNGGVNAAYGNTQCAMVAYREFTLPAGTYDLSFSWRCQGQSNADGLKVCWLPTSTATNSAMMGQPAFANQAINFNGAQMLSGSSEWKTEIVTVSSSGSPMKLVFLWANDANGNFNPGACVDFVQIASKTCSTPSNINASIQNGSDATVTWSGTAASYDIQYRAFGDPNVTTVNGVVGNSHTIQGLPEGLYDFWIRSICGSDTSVWVSRNNVLVYTAGAQCIDYINFNAPTTVCTTGNFDNPYQTTQVVDNGYTSSSSQHTFHFNPGETDARTENRLQTVPDGDVVSVRLGNWENGAHGESITYSLPLDANSQTILSMNYAIVLEAPGHGAAADPRFTLEIMDANNQVLDAVCTKVDFYADAGIAAGWQIAHPEGFQDVVWKDWTTIGVNLTPYAGQTVKIRLTTVDCDYSAHFGYAYFTLGCSEASISGLSCGDIKSSSIAAPDGFVYEWYKKYVLPRTVVSTDKDFAVTGTDTATYCCDVIFAEESRCKFTLEASLMPRYPEAKFAPKWTPKNCQNYVTFQNSSAVTSVNGPTTERCTSFKWNFGNDSTSSLENPPPVYFPDTGGTYFVDLVVGISEDMCLDTMQVKIVIPPIGETHDTVRSTICQGDHIIFNGQKFTKQGQYPFKYKSIAGCDSSVVLDLTVIDKIESTVYDSICAYGEYNLNGQIYKKTGTYMSTIQTDGGCDSVITLHLLVRDAVTVQAIGNDVLNGPKSGSITLNGLKPGWTYSVNGVDSAQVDSLDPGTYTIIYTDEYGCASDPFDVVIDVQCLMVKINKIPEICADDSSFFIPVKVLDGNLVDINIEFSADAKAEGFVNETGRILEGGGLNIKIPRSANKTEYPRPNIGYTLDLVFNDFNCGESREKVSFDILYPSWIMEQKWNDVIAILNEKYNGGYEFTPIFLWKKNGSVMDGQTQPYLYLNEIDFNLSDRYSVVLTRVDDGKPVETCDLTPVIRTNTQDYPTQTVVTKSQAMSLVNTSGNGSATWYDVQGRMYAQYEIHGENPEIISPDISGFYLLVIETENNRVTHKVFVK